MAKNILLNMFQEIQNMSKEYKISVDFLKNVLIMVINKIVQKYYDSANVFCQICDKNGIRVFFYEKPIEGVFGQDLLLEDVLNFMVTLNMDSPIELPDLQNNKCTSELPFKYAGEDILVMQKVLHMIKHYQIMQTEYDAFKPYEGSLMEGYIIKIQNSASGSVILYVALVVHEVESVVSCKAFNNNYKTGEKIYVYIREVSRANQGKQIRADISSEEYLFYLLKRYIPELCDEEIAENSLVRVRSIVRVPGRKSIVVIEGLNGVNPISVSMGVGGVRIKSINDKLRREFLQFLEYQDDNCLLIRNMYRSLEDLKVEYHEFNNEPCYFLIIDKDNIGTVIGSKGVNVVLLKKMLNSNVSVVLEEDYLDMKLQYEKKARDRLIALLGISILTSKLLVANGIYDIGNLTIETLLQIDGIEAGEKAKITARLEEIYIICKQLTSDLDIEFDLAMILVSNGINKIDDITLSGLRSIKSLQEDDLYKELYDRVALKRGSEDDYEQDHEDSEDLDDKDGDENDREKSIDDKDGEERR